jgi:hypothetical protein
MIDALPLLLGPEGYQISRSVRLRSSASAYFNRTMAAGGVTVYTFSTWVKRGELGTIKPIVQGYLNNNNYGHIIFKADNTIEWREFSVAVNYGQVNTNAVFRDPSAWYHIVVVRNGTSLLIYVNGVSQTLTVSTAVNAAGGYLFGGSTEQRIGRDQVNSAFFDGYLTECYLIDGQPLTPLSFGETNTTTGVWQPKKYAGTYGTNGFYLNFSDNSAATAAAIGKDYSGNGNNWTPNNISVTAGVTYDSMLDVPTQWADGGNGRGNYCTLNPIHYNNATITEANLKHTSAGAGSVGRGTVAVSSGKWYYEFTLTSLGAVGSFLGGIIDSQQPNNTPTNLATVTGAMWLYRDDGYTANAGGSVNTGVTYTNNDVISVAFDVDGQKIWWAKNGTWLSSGNPAAGTNAQYTNVSSTANSFMPFVNEQAATSAGVFNFGQRPFSYTPPSGFKALNTLNLPTPTILKGNQYFDATTYTANSGGSPRTITGIGFAPDLIVAKSRSGAYIPNWWDKVRGASVVLASDRTDSEASLGLAGGNITAFNNDGWTMQTGTVNFSWLNNGTDTYVAWLWKEGATQGFDIVTYTGNGSSQNINHSLGVAPRMMIVKKRSTTGNWPVYHASLGNATSPFLNLTNAANSQPNLWNSTTPTSSVFTVGSDGETNANTATFVAYLFSEVAGFSKAFSYTGNGSTDGPFVFLGFRPKYVMFKRSDSTGSWFIEDSSRGTYNVMGPELYAESSAAESTVSRLDFLSNGFKLRAANAGDNASGGTYIGIAFAEVPYKFALGR